MIDIDKLHEENKSFSSNIPGLQIAWDSTSLGMLKTCPRKYYLTMIEGWHSKSRPLPLVFGIQYHKALELFDKAKAEGLSHIEAVRIAVRHALELHDNSIDKNDPEYMSHMERTTDCTKRNRENLVRAIIWYLDHFENDSAETLIMSNGKPAVELTFKMDFPMPAGFPEDLLLCGHMDRVVDFGGDIYVMDHKTTAMALSDYYFDGYNPDNQVSLYTVASTIVLGQQAKGVIISACQLAVGFCRFMRRPINRTKGQNAEWIKDTQHWIEQARVFAETGHWPMNDTACDKYGGCVFRDVCRADPVMRERLLKSDFTRRIWDPMQAR